MTDNRTYKGTADMTVLALAQCVADSYCAACGDTFQDRGMVMPLNHAQFPAAIATFTREISIEGADDIERELAAARILRGMLNDGGDKLHPLGMALVGALLCSMVDEVYQVMEEAAANGSPEALAKLRLMGEFRS